jgi:hypothetical protein
MWVIYELDILSFFNIKMTNALIFLIHMLKYLCQFRKEEYTYERLFDQSIGF